LVIFIDNKINVKTFKRFFMSFVRKREFDWVNKKCSLEFFKNVFIFQGKQPYLSIVVEFQSSNLNILANKGNNKIIELRTNTIALNTTLNIMKLCDSPVCEACPCNATELLQHFLLECPAYKNMRSMFSRNCWPYACLSALSGFHRVVALTKTIIFNWGR
jgi:hypothetical protein